MAQRSLFSVHLVFHILSCDLLTELRLFPGLRETDKVLDSCVCLWKLGLAL